MTASTKNAPRHESPAKNDRKKLSVAQIRDAGKAKLGELCEKITGLEYEAGGVLRSILATYPDTPAGRKGFYSWASAACGGRKEGMIRRWMTAADVLHRVPTFKNVSTKLDTLQYVSGLPDADIIAIATSFEGKPAPTEASVKKAALKHSEVARKREDRRVARETDALASTRTKNDAAVEQLVGKNFVKFADDWTTLQTLAESKPNDALKLCALLISTLAAKHAMMPRAVKKMLAKFDAGDHLETVDES